MRHVLAPSILLLAATVSQAQGQGLEVSKFDTRVPFGKLDNQEAAVLSRHQTDPVFAALDTNHDGQISDAEALDYAARSKEAKQPYRQANLGLFYVDKPVADAQRAVDAARPKQPDPCAWQRFFIRRDRLDTFQYRGGRFISSFSKGDAKGASLAVVRDEGAGTTGATVNGRLSYLLWANDPSRWPAPLGWSGSNLSA